MALFAWSERQAYRLAVKVIPLYPKYFVYEGFFKRRNPLKECYLLISGDESYNLRREFLDGEREKNKIAEDYRKKKISLLEKIVQQQSELIEIQTRTTTALEVIATKFHESTQSPSPYSLSPVIKFN